MFVLGKDVYLFEKSFVYIICVVMMKDVVKVVIRFVVFGDVVLFLFVCVSLDMFKNYMYCGDVFK